MSKLKLLNVVRKKINNESRMIGLYRCICGKEQWVRTDIKTTRFRSCGCPPKRYTLKTKKCTGCRKYKRVNSFYICPKTTNPRPKCKKCMYIDNKTYISLHPIKTKKVNQIRRKQHNARIRFSLSLNNYNEILKSFGECCNICGNKETRKDRKTLSLDHDHKTGKIRGALCTRCNLLIGYAKDSINILNNSIKYLQRETMAS